MGGPTQREACTDPWASAGAMGGGSLRVFRQFAWLDVGFGKVALSRPAHQRVTPAVRRFDQNRDTKMIRLQQSLLSLALLIAIPACSSLSSTPYAEPQDIPTDTTITLERTICFGTCPAYKLTISADGAVVFTGDEYVRVKGIVHSNINKDQLKQLISEFTKTQYFSLKDSYISEEDGCPEVWTDSPTITTSIRINGQYKSIVHYLGCQENNGESVFPKELTDLEDKIDEIIGTRKWIE